MTVYLLDTSAIIDDSSIFHQFEPEDTLIISTMTIQELDGLKESKRGDVSRQSSSAIAVIESCRKRGKLRDGVDLENGTSLLVKKFPKESIVYVEHGITPDNQIIATGYEFQKEYGLPVEVVSTDNNFKIIAADMDMGVFEFISRDQAQKMEGYTGYVELDDTVLENSLVVNGAIHIAKIPEELKVYNGTYILFGHQYTPYAHRNIGVVNGEYVELVKGTYMNQAGRFRVKNIGQRLLAHALMDKQKTVITCEGVAGTGKTLEALAYSILQAEENTYSRVICYRAVASLDEGHGFLPGDLDAKLAPWAQPIFDNLEVLGRLDAVKSPYEDDDEKGSGIVEIGAITFARGRSLPNVLIIVDEAQNLTRHQAKTLATRLGEGAKIIFLYDREQIDSRFLDKYNNGGTHVANRLRGQKFHSHILLTETVRSDTAAACAKLL